MAGCKGAKGRGTALAIQRSPKQVCALVLMCVVNRACTVNGHKQGGEAAACRNAELLVICGVPADTLWYQPAGGPDG